MKGMGENEAGEDGKKQIVQGPLTHYKVKIGFKPNERTLESLG